MNRLHEIIRHLVDHIPGCGQAHIVKSVYLVDYEARRYLGRPLTELTYQLGERGPFSAAILQAIEDLCTQGLLRQEELAYADGKFASRFFNAAPRDDEAEFDAAERAILNSVVTNYGCMPVQILLDEVVGQTEPMIAAIEKGAFGQPLHMQLADGAARVPGLELERVWEADAELRAGRGTRLDELTAKRTG